MVPELLVTDFETSVAFWRDVLGFVVAYARPGEAFAYLERSEGAQVMLSERSGVWETAPMERPFGRRVMFQLYVEAIAPVLAALIAAGGSLYRPEREVWRQTGDRESGQREFFVLDPDGYLIMVAEHLGERPLETT